MVTMMATCDTKDDKGVRMKNGQGGLCTMRVINSTKEQEGSISNLCLYL